jgi:hypothetical protein
MYLEEAKKIEDADKTSFTEKSAVLNHVMWTVHSLSFPHSCQSSSHLIYVVRQKTQLRMLLQVHIRLCWHKKAK